jgi:1-acyl-sn-glycerol-3-phosphate acyltransferase
MTRNAATVSAYLNPSLKFREFGLKCPRDHRRKQRTLLKKTLNNLQATIVFSFCTVSTIFWVTPLMVFALLKLIIPVTGFRRLMTRWIMAIGENWVSCNAAIFGSVNSTRWDVRGLEGLTNDEWYLVIANHQTWVDIVALQTALNRRIPFLKFFIKQELIWFPFLGMAWWGLDMPFMKRYSKSYLAKYPHKKGKDLEATKKACEKFRYTPTSVINFIEGTRFTEEKKVKRASPFNNLLPPRAGGLALALDSMGSMFNAILDITIVYPNGTPQFWAMCYGQFDHVIIDIRRRPVEEWMAQGDYVNDREFRREFHQWLTQVWREKDEQIESISAGAND